tara:strand:+ start:667 stop:1293 length:627 start_codon:yes stop_codon:yes gene_type:complete
MKNLDNILPVFPLNGAILLPQGNLPLNIFEERYIEMVDYSLSKNKIIGMIQTMENKDDFYKIGCCGKITSYNETKDGRYLINLLGLKNFKIVKELNNKNKFRIFEVDFSIGNNNEKKIEEIMLDKSVILEKFKQFINKTDLETNKNSFESIDSIELDDLVRILAMSCPFSVSEKQMLLESKNNNVLAKNLITLFDFYNSEVNSPGIIN